MSASHHTPARLLTPVLALAAVVAAGCGSSGNSAAVKSACANARTVIARAHAAELKNFPALSDPVKTKATLAAVAETEGAVRAVAHAASGEESKKLTEYAESIARQHRVITAAAAHETAVVQAEDPGLNEALREGAAQFAKTCGAVK